MFSAWRLEFKSKDVTSRAASDELFGPSDMEESNLGRVLCSRGEESTRRRREETRREEGKRKK